MLAEVTAPSTNVSSHKTRICPGCSREKPLANFDGNELCRVCEIIAQMPESPRSEPEPKPSKKKSGAGVVYQRTPAVQEIAQKLKQPAKTPLPTAERLIIHADSLAAQPMQWLVKDLIPVGGLALVAGHPGIGKSFWSLDTGLKIAQNKPVLYVVAEGQRGLKNRVEAWKGYHGKSSGQLYIYPKAINLLDAAQVDKLCDQMEDIGPALIIIDTLSRCMDGNENNTSTMNRFVANCTRFQERFDAATLLVHHLDKTGAAYRGSSVLEAACDAMLELREEDGQIVLHNTKNKDAALLPDQPLELKVVKLDTGERSCVILPAATE